jgi:hypothetical protein
VILAQRRVLWTKLLWLRQASVDWQCLAPKQRFRGFEPSNEIGPRAQ